MKSLIMTILASVAAYSLTMAFAGLMEVPGKIG